MSHLVHSRHFGSFVEQQLYDLNVPHLRGFDQWSLCVLTQQNTDFNALCCTLQLYSSLSGAYKTSSFQAELIKE